MAEKPTGKLAGRPPKYKEEYCDKLVEFMAQGFPYETFAAEIGVNRDTLYAWEKAHPLFSDAKKRARDLQYKALITTGLAGMIGQVQYTAHKRTKTLTKTINGKPSTETFVDETKGLAFNSTAWIFMMKNCFGWRDIVEFSEDDTVDTMDFGDDE